MLALHRDGRQAEALAAYRAYDRVLAEDGLEPSAPVQALRTAILATPEAVRDAAGEPAAWSGAGEPAARSRAGVLVGRDGELATARRLLRGAPAGDADRPGRGGQVPAGRRAARLEGPAHLDGARTVWLAALPRAPRGVAPRWPRRSASPDPDALVDALAGRDLLLVLDNAEHVLDAVAELAARRAGAVPGGGGAGDQPGAARGAGGAGAAAAAARAPRTRTPRRCGCSWPGRRRWTRGSRPGRTTWPRCCGCAGTWTGCRWRWRWPPPGPRRPPRGTCWTGWTAGSACCAGPGPRPAAGTRRCGPRWTGRCGCWPPRSGRCSPRWRCSRPASTRPPRARSPAPTRTRSPRCWTGWWTARCSPPTWPGRGPGSRCWRRCGCTAASCCAGGASWPRRGSGTPAGRWPPPSGPPPRCPGRTRRPRWPRWTACCRTCGRPPAGRWPRADWALLDRLAAAVLGYAYYRLAGEPADWAAAAPGGRPPGRAGGGRAGRARPDVPG